MHTIVAISTAHGAGGIGIIRLSGDRAFEIAEQSFVSSVPFCEQREREMKLGRFIGEGFDERCMCVKFVAPFSYTGENLVEFHVHGGVFLCRRVLETLIQRGAKLAECGEFTQRAVLNGKMSLDEAEGVADMISADSAVQLNRAYRQMTGKLYAVITSLQEEIEEMLVACSAAIDYPEEVEEEVYEQTPSKIISVRQKVEELASTAQKGRYIKNGILVAIIGKPNSGKSSLLNAILGEERAIVTDVEGTTRDTIEESILHEGVKIRFLDTAGIRESEDIVEKVGIERAKQASLSADVIVFLLDGTKQKDDSEEELIKLFKDKKIFYCINKCDAPIVREEEHRRISAKTGEGIKQLLDDIASLIGTEDGEIITEARHVEALFEARESLVQAENNYNLVTIDCTAVDLRNAWSALGKITGKTADEAIIEGVFEKFCVGK